MDENCEFLFLANFWEVPFFSYQYLSKFQELADPWFLGDPYITATSLNAASKSKFSLMPMKFQNLPQIANCSKELSFYKCFGLKLLEKERYQHCPNFCIPIIWKSAIEMGTNKSLTICETFEDNYCISQSMARIISW